MFKRTRILSLGLAMALCMAQTAQAEILITPLDVSNPAGQGVQIVPESRVGREPRPRTSQAPRRGTRASSPAPQVPRREI